MNVIELRELLKKFNACIVWKSNGLDFKIEYYKGVGYLNKPNVTINGNKISTRHAFSAACTMFRNFKSLLSVEQFNQLKFVMYVDNTYYGKTKHGEDCNLYELIRFEKEVISEAAAVLLIDETVRR